MTIIDKKVSNETYQQFLAEIVSMVLNHRTRAVQSVQTISNQLYWNIGELIIKKEEEETDNSTEDNNPE